MKTRHSLLALLLALMTTGFFAQSARADILYIDMDNATDEIKTIQDTIKNSHDPAIRAEKLVVLPSRTPDQEAILLKLRELDEEHDRVGAKGIQYFTAQGPLVAQMNQEEQKPNPDMSVVKRLTVEIKDLQAKRIQADADAKPQFKAIEAQEAALQNQVRFNMDELKKTLEDYQAQHKTFETVVMSGHHDYKSFMGMLGTMSKADLVSAFQAHPDVAAGVKSVIGMGCYSVNEANHDFWWKALPNVQMIGGYDLSAPKEYRGSNMAFLRSMIERGTKIRQAGEATASQNDVSLISRMARELPGFNDVNAALCTRAVCVGINLGNIDMNNLAAVCTQGALDDLSKDAARAENLLGTNNTAAVTEDVPCDGQHSWLRSYYDKLRMHQHCGVMAGPYQMDFFKYTSKVDSIIRLIDFQSVYDNFKTYYKPQLERLNSLPAECKLPKFDFDSEMKCVPPPDRTIGSDEISRKDFLKYLDTVRNSPCIKNPAVATTPLPPVQQVPYWQHLWNSWFGTNAVAAPPAQAPKGPISPADQAFYSELSKNLDKNGYRLNCIPLTWVDAPTPGTEVQQPNCD
jgi:hypothetical protein